MALFVKTGTITSRNNLGTHVQRGTTKAHFTVVDPNNKLKINSINALEKEEVLYEDGEDRDSHVNKSKMSISQKNLEDLHDFLDLDDDDNLNGLEDGRKSKVEFQKLQIMDIATGLVSMIGASITVLCYDLSFDQKDNDLLVTLLWMVFASTIVAIILDIFRYLQQLKYFKSRNLISHKETLYSSGEIWALLLEIFLLLLQPYPFITKYRIDAYTDVIDSPYYYYVNDIFCVLMSSRLYVFVRIILNASIYRSPSARRLSSMYGAENNYLYACKCLMRDYPFHTVFLQLLGSIVAFGYMIRICERPLDRNPEVTILFSSYWNSMWCIITTMTTVGYGDFYPRTHFGRLVIFICCIWGVFCVSLMVVTLTNVLAMNNGEEKALIVLQRLQMRRDLKSEAAYVLTSLAKVGMNNRNKAKPTFKNRNLEEENKALISGLKRHIGEFKQLSRSLRNLDDSGNINEEMARQFEFIRDEIKDIKQQQADVHKVVADLNTLIQAKLSLPQDKTSFLMNDTSEGHQRKEIR